MTALDPVRAAEVARELRAKAKTLAATIEPLARWSVLLEVDPARAFTVMQKLASCASSTNETLLSIAKDTLASLSPDRAEAAAARLREEEKRALRNELRDEIEDEVCARLGFERHGCGDDEEREVRHRIIMAAMHIVTGHPLPRAPRRAVEHDNVVAFRPGPPAA